MSTGVCPGSADCRLKVSDSAGVVDINGLVHCLSETEGRIDEIHLLRFVSLRQPDEPESDDLRLFREHFELYHALYLLAESGLPGKYLHVGMAHVSVVSVPGEGRCAWFDEEHERFCNRPAAGTYCVTHKTLVAAAERDGSVRHGDMRSYYLDRRNLKRMDASGLRLILDGVLDAARNHEQLLEAARRLGLPQDASLRRLQERFRHLVKIEHPDVGGDPRRFRELYDAYELLYAHFTLKQNATDSFLG